MQYFEAYNFYFKSPKWWLNLLLAGVCLLVPIAGPMVLLGWAIGLLERSPRQWRPGDDFDVNKLGAYITRGVWPILVQLVISVPVSMLFGAVWFTFVFSSAITMTPRAGPPRFFFLVMPGYFIGLIVMSVIIHIISVPLCLRAALTQDFAQAFNVSWVLDFIKRTWVELLLSMLFLMGTSLLVGIAGMILCCVGYIPAVGLIQLAGYHLWFQLYDLFLQRGGEPIPLKVQPLETRISDEEN
jgi:hypothetical protein